MNQEDATLPPHNIEAEQSVLGAILIEPSTLDVISDIITAEDFYREAHSILFDAMCQIHSRNQPIDLITLQAELAKGDRLASVGGLGYLTGILSSVPTSAHAEAYARIVKDCSTLRKVAAIANKIETMAMNFTDDGGDDVEEFVGNAEKMLFDVTQKQSKPSFVSIPEVTEEVYNAACDAAEDGGKQPGISTGFEALDSLTNGLQKSDLIIVAARPSMGKTAFCLDLAMKAALESNQAVALFSLEMSKEQIGTRILCAEALLVSQNVKSGKLSDDEWKRLSEATERINEAPVFVDDNGDTTVMSMRSKCRMLDIQYGLGLIVVDYLQLLHSSKRTENRQQEVSDIARGLKALAKELKVPVVCLSQLSRAVEQRENKRPILSDLRESGSIEQEADIVSFLYREEYYRPKKTQDDEELTLKSPRIAQDVEVIVAKNRNGPVGVARIGFIPEYAKFINLSYREDEPTGF